MLVTSPLYPAVILLMSSVAGLTLSKMLSLSPIVGFFIIGAAIGSQGFGLIDSHAPGLHFLGELGVCFLLFDVGLHLSLKDLRAGWHRFIAVGTLQFVIVTILLAGALNYFGLGWQASFILGAIFSLSSTALVLKMLTEHHEEGSPVGKKATEILVFQDIAGIIILVFLTGMDASLPGYTPGFSIMDFLMPLGKMLAAAVIMIVIGRFALKPAFQILIAVKNDEVFTSFALLIVFFTSWVTQSLGLSLALGAFLGGLALSESSYSHIIRAEVAPFRGLLLALFFLTVGMSLDLTAISGDIVNVLLILTAFYLIKALGNWLALVISGMDKPASTRLSFLLSQGSEFAFILLAAAKVAGVVPADYADIAVTIVGISLALTPLLGGLGCALSRSQCTRSTVEEHEDDASARSEVIIVQFDDYARILAGILTDAGVKYRGHDRDMERLTYAKSRGFEVFYSDPNRPRTIGRALAGKVRAVVSLIEDDEIIRFLVTELKKISPAIPIFAATSDPRRLELLNDLGVENSFLKTESSLTMLAEVLLDEISVPKNQIKEVISRSQRINAEGVAFPRVGTEAPAPMAAA